MSSGRTPFKWYTVYLSGVDQFVVSGTAEECAAFMETAVGNFYTMVSRVASGTNKRYTIIVEDMETGHEMTHGAGNTGRRPVDYEKIRQLYRMGFSDKEIMKETGSGDCTIRKWREKRGLAPNGKRGRPRKTSCW